MPRLLYALLLFCCLGTTLAGETQHGFLVFPSTGGVVNYAVAENGSPHLQGKSATGSIDEFLTANGRIYHLHMLLGKVTELNADLQPLHTASVKSNADVPYWLGTWDEGVLILNDNAVVYLDADLNEVARLPLDPRKFDQITPALNPVDFDTWDHRGYILTNSAELFIIPLARPRSIEPLPAALRLDGISSDGQWIDATKRTLNLRSDESREEHDAKLQPGEWRVIKEQVVYSYPLGKLDAPAQRRVVHEEREIHEPVSLEPLDKDPPGMIIDRRPPWRSEGRDKGTHIGIVSRTTPTYAEAFEEKRGQIMPDFAIVRLKHGGRYDRLQLFRNGEEGPLWFKASGKKQYLEPDMEEHVLRLLPEPYDKLRSLPELKDAYFHTLAY